MKMIMLRILMWSEDMNIIIKKIEYGTSLCKEFIDFANNCSWICGKHISDNVRNNVFKDWEAEFVALDGNKIVGYTSIMKTDYYPTDEYFPWVSGIFVAEEYRGNRISGLLIDYANEYAKSFGFSKTYIPSEYLGLYEHYGYQYVRDIRNYGGEMDHLFVKEI